METFVAIKHHAAAGHGHESIAASKQHTTTTTSSHTVGPDHGPVNVHPIHPVHSDHPPIYNGPPVHTGPGVHPLTGTTSSAAPVAKVGTVSGSKMQTNEWSGGCGGRMDSGGNGSVECHVDYHG